MLTILEIITSTFVQYVLNFGLDNAVELLETSAVGQESVSVARSLLRLGLIAISSSRLDTVHSFQITSIDLTSLEWMFNVFVED